VYAKLKDVIAERVICRGDEIMNGRPAECPRSRRQAWTCTKSETDGGCGTASIRRVSRESEVRWSPVFSSGGIVKLETGRGW
jgi:hypothetical protein